MAAQSDAELKMQIGGARGGKWLVIASVLFYLFFPIWGVLVAFDFI